jgi:ribonuclease T2
MKRTLSILLVFLLLLLTGSAIARSRRKPSGRKGQAKFDYYLLSLSWAPNFCAGHPNDKTSECKAGSHTAFVLHGLWPQATSGQPPLACKASRPVPSATVKEMLELMPTRMLIQHEWDKHGTCSGLTAADYFGKVKQAFTAVKVPEKYTDLADEEKFSIKDIEQDFASANSAPPEAFRISCHAGELVSVEACLNKDLQYQACSRSVRECPSGKVLLRPPQ